MGLTKTICIWLACALVIAGCKNAEQLKENKKLSTKIESVLNNPQLNFLDLANISEKNWDKVCIVTPYSTNESARKTIGFQWDIDKNTNIGGDDSITLLLLIKDNQIVEYVQHPRNKGDFSFVTPKCLPKNNAKLVIAGAKGESYRLVVKPN